MRKSTQNSAPGWMNGPIMVIDTETTDVTSPENNHIIQIAILKFMPRRPWRDMEAWTTMAGSPKPIAAEATLVHGIRDEDIAELPPLEERMDRIMDILSQGEVFLAYNAEFDISFLREAHKRAGCARALPFNKKNVIDPLSFARGLYPHAHGWKLKETCVRLGCSLRRAHDALEDAMSAAELMMRLCIKHDLPHDLESLIALQEKYDSEWEDRRRAWLRRKM